MNVALVPLLGAFGYSDFLQHKGEAWFFALLVVCQALVIPDRWRRYVLVKSGAEVYVQPSSLRVPIPVSALVTAVLTLLALVVSGLSVLAVSFQGWSAPAWLIAGGVNAALWSYTVYCWYGVNQDRPRRRATECGQEALQGVWPPAPRAPQGLEEHQHDNHD